MNRRWNPITLTALCVVAIVLLANWAANQYNIRVIYQNTKQVTHTQEVLLSLNTILSLATDAETGQRGYLITGRESYLEPYHGSRERIERQLRELESLTADNFQAQQRIPAIRQTVDERFDILERGVRARRDQGFDAAKDLISTDRGKEVMDLLRKDISELIFSENELLAKRAEGAERSFDLVRMTGLLMFVLAVAAVAGYAYQQSRMLRWRDRSAAALFQERELLRVTLGSIGDGVITTDIHGKVTFLNRIAETLTGWTTGEAQHQPLESVFQIVNETTRAPVDNPALRALAEGVIVGLANHTVLISKDQSERAIADSAAPIRGIESELLGSVLVFRDVTADRDQENKLRISEARKAAILDTALDAVITCDQDGCVVEFNAAAERIFGYRAEEVMGKCLKDFIVPQGLRTAHQMGLVRYLRTGQTSILNRRVEQTALRSDGTIFPVELAVTSIETGQQPLFTAHLRDITERKHAEEKLQQQFRLLALTSDVSRALATGDNLQAALQRCAEAFSQHLGTALVRIWIWNDDAQMLELQASAGLLADLDGPQRRIPAGQFAIGKIAAERRPHFTNSVLDDPDIPEQDLAQREGLVAFAGFPLLVGSSLVGVIAVLARSPLETQLLAVMDAAGNDIAVGIDRQRAIRLEQERGRLWQVTLSSIGDAVLTTDVEGRVNFLNETAEKLTGYAMQEVVGQPAESFFRIVHEQTGEPVENPVRQVLAQGEAVALSSGTVLIAKDGTRRPIDDSAAPVRSGDQIFGAVLVFRDISQQMAAERKIRESANRFQQLADAMPQIVWVVRPDGTSEYYNQKWYDYTDARPEDCLGRVENEWIHPDDRARSAAAWNECLRTGERFEIERRIRSKTGEYRWFLGRALPVRDTDENIEKWFGTSTDIEDYKRAQSDRHKFFSLVENSMDFIGMTDLAGVPFYVNRAGLTMTGLNDVTAVQNLTIQDFFFADDRDQTAEEMLSRVLRDGHVEGEIRFRNFLSGQALWMIYHLFCLLDSEGRVSGLATISRDITERKALEEQLRIAAAHLSEANQRKNEFLATLAHELRNPMAPIRTGLELMKLAAGDPQVIEETRSMMERQAGQMVRLIDDLLDVSRITQGKLQLRKARIELADVIKSSVEATKPFIDEAGHDLEVVLPDRPVFLDADPNRLAQVFSNLLSNASKYTKEGGRIRLTAETSADEVVVRVSDTGIGIPVDMQENVFEMFAQIDRPLEKGYTGLGIGLTLVKRLVELHAGRVEVQSEGADQGSEFTVRLPLGSQTPRSESASGAPVSAAAKQRSFQILVVDDNKVAADMLRMMLKILGNTVRMAHDGQEGFELAEQIRPDIVLMDLGMPRLNGYEAARKIRGTDWGQGIWLIALTGWGQDEDKQRTQAAGFDYHLTKPAEPAALQTLLNSLEPRS